MWLRPRTFPGYLAIAFQLQHSLLGYIPSSITLFQKRVLKHNIYYKNCKAVQLLNSFSISLLWLVFYFHPCSWQFNTSFSFSYTDRSHQLQFQKRKAQIKVRCRQNLAYQIQKRGQTLKSVLINYKVFLLQPGYSDLILCSFITDSS